MTRRMSLIALALSVALGIAPAGAIAQVCTASPNVTVLSGGLNNPRGLKFGPGGDLYVAEGGTGGPLSTAGSCAQVIPPIGPYTGGFTARISKISPTGVRTTVVDNLPSSQTSAMTGALVSGVADIAFVGDTLYGLLAGAGCSHGISSVPNGVFRLDPGGATPVIANLSAYQAAHPVANPEPDDFEPDGTWYSMVEERGDFYAVEPNHGELVRIGQDGSIRRIVDISAAYGHVVPTAIAHDGNFYVGTLGTFENNFQAMVLKITPSGKTEVVISGLNSILGLAVRHGTIYVLENVGGFPFPCAGRVLRVNKSGHLNKAEEIASGLMLPTAMTLGPDNVLYVSRNGFGFPPTFGEVVRIPLD